MFISLYLDPVRGCLGFPSRRNVRLSFKWKRPLDQMLSVLRAAGEHNRLRILALCAGGDLTVRELTSVLGQSQPGVSRHLKLLCDARLLERYQEGSWAYFHLPTSGVPSDIVRFLLDRVRHDDPTITRDLQRFENVKQERAVRSETYFRENAARWDSIRALHVDEAEVEQALTAMLGAAPVESILDIGTGTGRMLQLMGDRAREAIGVDLSRDMLAVARTNLSTSNYQNCSVRQADMYDLPFKDGGFDLAVSHMVLHFADRPQDVFREASRVLKPGGQFVIVDFAPHEMEALRDEHAHRRLGFRVADIEEWGAEVGLETVESRTLPGKQLTVCIWKTRLSAEIHELNPAAAPFGSVS